MDTGVPTGEELCNVSPKAEYKMSPHEVCVSICITCGLKGRTYTQLIPLCLLCSRYTPQCGDSWGGGGGGRSQRSMPRRRCALIFSGCHAVMDVLILSDTMPLEIWTVNTTASLDWLLTWWRTDLTCFFAVGDIYGWMPRCRVPAKTYVLSQYLCFHLLAWVPAALMFF